MVAEHIARFLADEDAQDVAEYALLGLFIGIVGVLVWANILNLMGARYTEYNSNVQGLWEPPDPPTTP
jgi:Flp pilus assembly pilin Flp